MIKHWFEMIFPHKKLSLQCSYALQFVKEITPAANGVALEEMSGLEYVRLHMLNLISSDPKLSTFESTFVPFMLLDTLDTIQVDRTSQLLLITSTYRAVKTIREINQNIYCI